MSTANLLGVQPLELKFPCESKKQTSCTMQLTNKTDHYVAFKVKTTKPKKYSVRPHIGVLAPRSTCDVTITMQGQEEVPPDFQCKDKFLIQSIAAKDGATTNDIDVKMFNKEPGKVVEDIRLSVAYIRANPPSATPEESKEALTPSMSPASVTEVNNQSSSPLDSFNKEPGKVVEDVRLSVAYIRANPPSAPPEESKEALTPSLSPTIVTEVNNQSSSPLDSFNEEQRTMVDHVNKSVSYNPTNSPSTTLEESEESLQMVSLSQTSFTNTGNQISSPFDMVAGSVSTLVVENVKLGKTITSLEKLVEELRQDYEKLSTELMSNEALMEVFRKYTVDELKNSDVSLQVSFWRTRYDKLEAENKILREKITQLTNCA